jgi:peptidoglycan/LPS O-acetylase OafA/YrhL
MIVNRSKGRIFELDALRGIAALMVILFHFSGPAGGRTILVLQTGVELFFMISGFVILMTLERVRSSREFILSRVIRLYPAYWVCVTITSGLMIIFHFNTLSNIFSLRYLANLTMVQSWLSQPNLDDSYWTMIIELIFYIMMYLIYVSGKIKKIEFIGVVLVIFSLFYGRYFSFVYDFLNGLVFQYVGLVYFFPLFLSGILYYKIKFEKKSALRFGLLVLCIIAQVSLFRKLEWRSTGISIAQYAGMLFIYNSLFLLYVFDRLRFIVNRVTVFLGFISYPLYLIHNFLGVNILIPFLITYMSYWPAMIISVTSFIVLAYLIYRLVEKPAISYFRKKWLNNIKTIKAEHQSSRAA